MQIFNIFQSNLIRGSLKKTRANKTHWYAYVEHPTEKWRVYLRTAIFIHTDNNPKKFIVVKETRKDCHDMVWEPPKGRVEKTDGILDENTSIINVLAKGVLREMKEESRIKHITKLTHTGLVFQSQEPHYPKNHFFQYHIFRAITTEQEINRVTEIYKWYSEHPKAFRRLAESRREKDDISWFQPGITKLSPWWTPNIVVLYLYYSNINSI